MSILFGSDVDIQLANTSFNCNTTSSMSVALFTATDKGTYHFTGTLTATTQNSSFGFGFLINGTYKDLRTTDYTTGPLDVNLDFTADVGDVITLSASGIGTGSNLAVTEDVKKPREIYVGEGKQVYDYSAMRGPCPEGFHVPLASEVNGLRSIMIQLGLNTIALYGSNLLVPSCGYASISYYNGTPVIAKSAGGIALWTSIGSDDRAACFFCYSTDTQGPSRIDQQKTCACPIRPFKDIYVDPTASWTVMAGVLGGAGIFWNQTDGLISISGNGTTGYTIADKNLGATTTYNSGDTLSEANCGKLFQRGNNYGFSYTYSTIDSNTQVSTDNYGPGSYYSSNVFVAPVYGGNRFRDWSLNANNNLRGGATGVQQRQIGNVIEVYVGTTKVRPSETVLFDYGDWTNSVWTTTDKQGTITRTSSYISFYGSGFSQNELSEYEVDYTKNFLFEFRANIPNTTASYHRVSLGIVSFGTSWESNRRNKIWGVVNNTYYGGDTNNGPRDFFFRWENGTFTIGWDGVTKGTGTYTLTGQESPYLREQVYKNTLTIYTAKLTYL